MPMMTIQFCLSDVIISPFKSAIDALVAPHPGQFMPNNVYVKHGVSISLCSATKFAKRKMSGAAINGNIVKKTF